MNEKPGFNEEQSFTFYQSTHSVSFNISIPLKVHELKSSRPSFRNTRRAR